METRQRALFFVLVAQMSYAYAASQPSFDARVARAKVIELQDATVKYFQNDMYPAIGESLATAMRGCTSRPNASLKKFTVVADVTPDGQFVRIAYRPNSDTANCLAAAMALFRAPPPPMCEYSALPVFFDMSVKP